MSPVPPPLAAAPGDPGLLLATTLVAAALLLLGLPFAVWLAARGGEALRDVAGSAARSPGRSLATGCGAALVTLFLLGASPAHAAVGLVAIAALLGFSGVLFVGLAAEARSLGLALRGTEAAPAEGAHAPAGGATALGWLVLSGLPLLPLAGFLVALYLGLRGAGAALLTAAARRT